MPAPACLPKVRPPCLRSARPSPARSAPPPRGCRGRPGGRSAMPSHVSMSQEPGDHGHRHAVHDGSGGKCNDCMIKCMISRIRGLTRRSGALRPNGMIVPLSAGVPSRRGSAWPLPQPTLPKGPVSGRSGRVRLQPAASPVFSGELAQSVPGNRIQFCPGLTVGSVSM